MGGLDTNPEEEANMTKNNMAELLQPWIGRISDADLREKVAEVYIEAFKRSSHETKESFLEMPFTLLTECAGITFLQHTLAVTAGAVALAEAKLAHSPELPYTIDMDRLIAGGLLHDVGKIMEIEPDGEGGYRKSLQGRCMRHPISGAALAYEMGLPHKLINCIGCHAKEGDGRPQTVETVLIHQADFATFNPLVMLQKGTLIQ